MKLWSIRNYVPLLSAQTASTLAAAGMNVIFPLLILRVFSVRLESGGIPKELLVRESDGIDSLWGEQCRSRTRWTCVNG